MALQTAPQTITPIWCCANSSRERAIANGMVAPPQTASNVPMWRKYSPLTVEGRGVSKTTF